MTSIQKIRRNAERQRQNREADRADDRLATLHLIATLTLATAILVAAAILLW